MKHNLILAGVLTVGLMVGTWCNADGPTAVNPGAGRARVKLPDLVVKSVSMTSIQHPLHAPTVVITVVVRNIGAIASGPCLTALYMLGLNPTPMPNMEASGSAVVGGRMVTLSVGPGAEVSVVFDTYANPGKCILMAMVDCPYSGVGEAPAVLGKLPEANELNNVFAMPYNNAQPLPQEFPNPAFL